MTIEIFTPENWENVRNAHSLFHALHRGLPIPECEECISEFTVCARSSATLARIERDLSLSLINVGIIRNHVCYPNGGRCYTCDDIRYYERLIRNCRAELARLVLHVASESDDICETCEMCTDCCECIYCECGTECHDDQCGYCEMCDNCCSCIHCDECEEIISENDASCSECSRWNRFRCESCCSCNCCGYCGERGESVCPECDNCGDCCECSHNEDGMDTSEHGTRSDISEFVERIGIEIEFHFGDNGGFGTVLSALRNSGLEVVDNRNTHCGSSLIKWTLKRDGSVHNGGELVSPILEYGNADHAVQIANALSALAGAGCSVSYSTGIHIHVEGRNEDLSYFDSSQLLRLRRMVYRNEDAIYAIASTNGEHRGTTYCRPFALSDTKDNSDINYDRYKGCNLQSFLSRGTAEFRYFDSHFDIARLSCQIAMCIGMMRNIRKGVLVSRNAFPKGTVRADVATAEEVRAGFMAMVKRNLPNALTVDIANLLVMSPFQGAY